MALKAVGIWPPFQPFTIVSATHSSVTFGMSEGFNFTEQIRQTVIVMKAKWGLE